MSTQINQDAIKKTLVSKISSLLKRFSNPKVALLAFAFMFLAKETVWRKFYCWLRNYPPLILPFPIVGNFPYLSQPLTLPGNHKTLTNLSKKYGPVYSIYLGTHYAIVINDRECFYEAMKERQDDYQRRPFLDSFRMIQHGTGVAGGNGKRWRMLRTIMQQRATNKQKGVELEGMITDEISTNLQWLYESKCKVGKGNDFDLRLLLRKESLNLAMRYLYNVRFGEDMSEQYYETQDWIRRIFEYLAAGAPSDFMPIFKLFPALNDRIEVAQNACTRMEKFIDGEIALHKQKLQFKQEEDYDVLDHFLKAQQDAAKTNDPEQMITDVDIRVSCWDLMAGQIDTTASSMEWLLYTMINYPDVQKKLQAELDRVVGPDRLPCLDDAPQLEYVTACICEILRFRHLSPTAIPHEAERDSFMRGYNVPKGTQVLVNFYSLHNNPDYWKKPEEFRPERFLEEERFLLDTLFHPESYFTKKESYKFLPYGQGRRRCVGYGIGRTVIWLKVATWFHCFEFRSQDEVSKMDIESEYLGITLNPLSQKVKAIPRKPARLLADVKHAKVETR